VTRIDQLRGLYRLMQRIRQAEQSLSTLFAENKIPGFIHSSIGQEATAAGVIYPLEAQDTLVSNHRGHGHAIARGVDLGRFFAEIMGRAGGYCAGRGGSMHVADASIGMLGANGIVGAGLPIALGSALAHQVTGVKAIAVVFFGDGALGEGVLHESLNLAKLWKLPLLMICENNGWSEFTPTEREFVTSLQRIASAFDIPSEWVDGNDVSAVFAAAFRMAAVARAGGPAILEARTIRIRGHYEGDPQHYRDRKEMAAGSARDPIAIAEDQLLAAGATVGDVALIRQTVEQEISSAVGFASASALPKFEAAFGDVYTAKRMGL
jgi:acetoin:2,6-dichlorophenolindophenol oxidoreductase subunit alpha